MGDKMPNTSLKIVCPHCNKSIILDEALTLPLEKEISKKIEEENNLKIEKIKLDVAKKDKEIKDLKSSVEEQIDVAVKEEKNKIMTEAKKKAEEQNSKELKDLNEQLTEKTKKLEIAEKQELQLRKEKRELDEAKKSFELELQRKLDTERKSIFEEASKKSLEEHNLKDKEKQKKIDDLTTQIGELKRKAEQGSQQTQGEVLEQELEQMLREQFTQDEIEPISTGVLGADILQKVCIRNGKVCGTILIESKNAKKWSNSWIQKLKNDQREAKADIGVIITTVLPEGISSFDCQEEIFIVSINQAIPVISILRNQLFELARVKSLNTGKDAKLEAIYQYLTGAEFKQKVQTIIESFSYMNEDLQREKRVMTKMWSKREKELQQVFNGVLGMYGGMQGILGSSMPEIKSLEMPSLLSEEDEGVVEELKKEVKEKHDVANEEIEEEDEEADKGVNIGGRRLSIIDEAIQSRNSGLRKKKKPKNKQRDIYG